MLNLILPAAVGGALAMWMQIGIHSVPAASVMRLEQIAEQIGERAEKVPHLPEAARHKLRRLLTVDYDACRARADACDPGLLVRNAAAKAHISAMLSRTATAAAPENSIETTLLSWIAANLGFAAPAPPRVVLVSRHTLIELFGSDRPHELFTLHALYSGSAVFLPDTWRPTGNRDKSILLHELVHHVQRSNGMTASCPGALERQAYDLQVKWLREQGEDDPYKVIGMDAFSVATLYSCPDINNRL